MINQVPLAGAGEGRAAGVAHSGLKRCCRHGAQASAGLKEEKHHSRGQIHKNLSLSEQKASGLPHTIWRSTHPLWNFYKSL